MLVVVVVDDGDLVVPEVLLSSGDRELTQLFKVDLVGGVGAHDVVAVRDGGLASVGLVVAVKRPELVHLGCPSDYAAILALYAGEIYEVMPDGTAVALEVALCRRAAGMAVDALDQGHGAHRITVELESERSSRQNGGRLPYDCAMS